jgi:hypothetical protein
MKEERRKNMHLIMLKFACRDTWLFAYQLQRKHENEHQSFYHIDIHNINGDAVVRMLSNYKQRGCRKRIGYIHA